MKKRRIASAVAVVSLASVAGAAGPAVASTHVKPKPGSYAVAPNFGGGYPSFTVTKTLKVTNFIGAAPTAAGCKLTGGYAPPFDKPKIINGHFTDSSSAYGGIKVLVTINGKFATDTKVVGHLIVKYKSKKYKSCNASTRYVANRK